MNYSENFLHMLFSLPTERYEVDPVLSRALEIILILHIDHEQNACKALPLLDCELYT